MFKLTVTFFALAALLQCAVVFSSPLPSHQIASAKAAGVIDDAQAGGFTFMKRQIVSATVDAANDDDIADSDTPDLGLPPLEDIIAGTAFPRQDDDDDSNDIDDSTTGDSVDSREDNHRGHGQSNGYGGYGQSSGYGGYGHGGLGYPQLSGPLEHTGLANFGDNLGDALDSVGEALGGLL